MTRCDPNQQEIRNIVQQEIKANQQLVRNIMHQEIKTKINELITPTFIKEMTYLMVHSHIQAQDQQADYSEVVNYYLQKKLGFQVDLGDLDMRLNHVQGLVHEAQNPNMDSFLPLQTDINVSKPGPSGISPEKKKKRNGKHPQKRIQG